MKLIFLIFVGATIATGEPDHSIEVEKGKMKITQRLFFAAPRQPSTSGNPFKWEVHGAIKQSCKHPYTAFHNCTAFALSFHQKCEELGWQCRSVDTACTGPDSRPHRLNIILLDSGDWHFVEPVNGLNGGVKRTGFSNPDAPTEEAICQALGEPMGSDGKCRCYVGDNSDTPMRVNTNPVTFCALGRRFRSRSKSMHNYEECEDCCMDRASYHEIRDHEGTALWRSTCTSACRNHLLPEQANSITAPRANDSAGIARGRTCSRQTTIFSVSSRYQQCRGCCLVSTLDYYFPRNQQHSCMAVCRANHQ